MIKVAVLDDYQAVAATMADWAQLGPDVAVDFFHEHVAEREALVERLAPYAVVCLMRERTPFPRALFERLPGLQLLVTTGMRNAAIDMEAAREHGVVVCGTGGATHGTAELAWALVLALARNLPTEDAWLRQGGWQRSVGTTLHGRTLGLLGLGRLGQVVARYGHAFGMDVLAWSHNLTAEHAAEHGASRVDEDELLRRADVVSIHLVLSERTRGLIGARELALMQPSAYLVNTSRGPIVDEDALVRALHDGVIAGAALDVYHEEPLPPDHPLLDAPNTVLTPHLGYVNDAAYEAFYRDTVEVIRSWRAGTPVRVIVPARSGGSG